MQYFRNEYTPLNRAFLPDLRSRGFLPCGVGETVRYWSEKTGIREGTIYSRHRKGWSAEEIINTPIHGKKGEKT